MSAYFSVRVNEEDKNSFNKTVNSKLTFDLVKCILVEEHGALKRLVIRNNLNELFGPGEALTAGIYICDCETENSTEGDLTIKLAQLRLLNRKHYEKSLDSLLSLINQANLLPVDEKIVNQYRNGCRTRESASHEQSTVATRGAFDLSNFDLGSLTSEFSVTVEYVNLSVTKVRTLVCEEVFDSNDGLFHSFLATAVPLVDNLRSFFFHLRQEEFHYTEAAFFQPVMTLFVERICDLIGIDKENCTGAQLPFSWDVQILNDNNIAETVTLSGKSDMVKLRGDISYDNISFLMELKVPFGALFHHATSDLSDRAKNQLIGQMMGTWAHSKGKRKAVSGALTDLFSIILSHSFSNNKRKFYVVKSAVITEDYLLHFCLLFIADGKIKSLLMDAIQSAHIKTKSKNETGGKSKGAKRSREPLQPVRDSVRKKKKNPNAKRGTRRRGKTESVYDDGTSVEEAMMSEAALNRWWARRSGFAELSEENLASLGKSELCLTD